MAERGAKPNVPVVRRRALRLVSSLFSRLLPDDYLELINPLWSTQELRGGPFMQQLGMVQRTILRLAFPGGGVREKPGPYTGSENGHVSQPSPRGAQPVPEPGPTGRDGSGPQQRSNGVLFEMPQRT